MATQVGEEGAVLADGKSSLDERLQARESERLAKIEQRQRDREEVEHPEETTQQFDKKFSVGKANVEAKLSAAGDQEKDKASLGVYFDGVVSDIKILQQLINDSTRFLSSYDIRSSQKVIMALEARAGDERQRLMPRKRFAFKSRGAKAGAAPIQPVGAGKSEADLQQIVSDFQVDKPVSLPASESVVHVLTHEEIEHKDVRLDNLKHCRVYLQGSASTVHLANLTGCTVCMGPTATSVFINDCADCKFVIACQQLRVHTTKQSDFYLHVTSRAIIEDCESLGFAPYNWSYDGLDAHYVIAGLDRARNTWNDVDDFKWLKDDEQSPNWRLLPEAERMTSWPSSGDAMPK